VRPKKTTTTGLTRILISWLQVSDEYLSGLASRYASELGTDRLEVLHHLDNLRQMSNDKMMMPEPTLNRCVIESPMSVHTYANLQMAEKFQQSSGSSRNFSPGIYAVSQSWCWLF